MEDRQLHLIEQVAARLQLGQGGVMQAAKDLVGHELFSLYDLSRAEADRLIVYLEQLEAVGCC